MRGYGWQSAASGGLAALAGILGQLRMTREEKAREERQLIQRNRERAQDMTELQLREAGAGARNLSDNASAERRARMTIDAAEARAEAERQRKAELDKGRLRAGIHAASLNPHAPKDLLERYERGEFDALDPDQVTGMFVTPYARDAAREDSQAWQKVMAGVRDAYLDGNRRTPTVRPTEKAAFASKMLDAFESTGKGYEDRNFWKFLEEIGEGDADDAARLGMTAADYSSSYTKRTKAKEKKSTGGGFTPPARATPSTTKGKPKKKSYEDVLKD